MLSSPPRVIPKNSVTLTPAIVSTSPVLPQSTVTVPKKKWEKRKVAGSNVQWEWTAVGADARASAGASAVAAATADAPVNEPEQVAPNSLPPLRERYKELLYNNEEEYNQRLGNVDRGSNDTWTKEETDYLIDLALSFDLKWPVIADRYCFKASHLEQLTPEGGEEEDHHNSRPLLELQARFYDVCSSATDNGDLKQAREVFSPAAEAQRRATLAERYKVSSSSMEREEKLRTLVGCLKTTLEQMEMERKESKGNHHHRLNGGGSSSNRLEHDLLMSTGLLSEDEHRKTVLSRFERDLLPIKNAMSAIYTAHKGPILASQLARQPLELKFPIGTSSSSGHTSVGGTSTSQGKQKQSEHSTVSSAVRCGPTTSQTATATGGGGNIGGQQNSTTSGGGLGILKHQSVLTNSKELSESIDKLLRQVCKTWPSTISVQKDSQTMDPKVYFLHINQSFLPPIPSRIGVESYNAMRMDAAVCCQLQKELETLTSVKDSWVAKLMEVRRSLRNSRRNLAKNMAQQQQQQQQYGGGSANINPNNKSKGTGLRQK